MPIKPTFHSSMDILLLSPKRKIHFFQNEKEIFIREEDDSIVSSLLLLVLPHCFP